MKIVVGGSMAFAKEQLFVKNGLEELGHEVFVTDDIDVYVDNPAAKDNFDEELKACLENDIVRSFFNKIKETDAYVVVNKEKRGIRGYLGTSVLMEIGLAYYLGKKIFLLEEIDKAQGYALEIAIMNPVILNGDLSGVGCVRKNTEMSLKEVADGANEIEDELGLNFDDVLHKFMQECGEFNDAVQKFRGRYCRSNVPIEEVKGEVGDLIFNLSSVCNRLGINPDEFPKFGKSTLDKFEGRKGEYRRCAK